ncbi:MAG: hypothetical protein AAFV49_20960 [Pseudomonadota bacterium]
MNETPKPEASSSPLEDVSIAGPNEPGANPGEEGGDGAGGAASRAENAYRRAIFSVPIDVVVAVGQAQPVIGELLAMRRDTVLPLAEAAQAHTLMEAAGHQGKILLTP